MHSTFLSSNAVDVVCVCMYKMSYCTLDLYLTSLVSSTLEHVCSVM